MKNSMGKKIVLIALTCVFSIGLVIAVLNAGTSTPKKDSYIEVGGGKIVYVPRTTQYVKFNGQVRKIARFASTLSPAEKDCQCPNCCKGSCYIIIYTDGLPIFGPIIILSVIWLAC
jgi:glycine/D-amino acid oxidase-like deaminating enzyme